MKKTLLLVSAFLAASTMTSLYAAASLNPKAITKALTANSTSTNSNTFAIVYGGQDISGGSLNQTAVNQSTLLA